jgi:PAS domain S-box-containing protein
VHPDDRERVFAEVERTHTAGEDFRLEYRLIAADGRVVWVLDETSVVRDTDYRPMVLQGFLVDITAGIEGAAPLSALPPTAA